MVRSGEADTQNSQSPTRRCLKIKAIMHLHHCPIPNEDGSQKVDDVSVEISRRDTIPHEKSM